MNYTYLLRCADSTLYCGWTNHLKERVKAHNAGHGAKYTRGRRPVHLLYYEVFDTKREAMQREAMMKRLTRKEKLQLVEKAGIGSSSGQKVSENGGFYDEKI